MLKWWVGTNRQQSKQWAIEGGQNANKGAGNHGKSGKATQSKTTRANLHSNESTTHAGGDHLLTNSRSPNWLWLLIISLNLFYRHQNCRNCTKQWCPVYAFFGMLSHFNCKLSSPLPENCSAFLTWHKIGNSSITARPTKVLFTVEYSHLYYNTHGEVNFEQNWPLWAKLTHKYVDFYANK